MADIKNYVKEKEKTAKGTELTGFSLYDEFTIWHEGKNKKEPLLIYKNNGFLSTEFHYKFENDCFYYVSKTNPSYATETDPPRDTIFFNSEKLFTLSFIYDSASICLFS